MSQEKRITNFRIEIIYMCPNTKKEVNNIVPEDSIIDFHNMIEIKLDKCPHCGIFHKIDFDPEVYWDDEK